MIELKICIRSSAVFEVRDLFIVIGKGRVASLAPIKRLSRAVCHGIGKGLFSVWTPKFIQTSFVSFNGISISSEVLRQAPAQDASDGFFIIAKCWAVGDEGVGRVSDIGNWRRPASGDAVHGAGPDGPSLHNSFYC
jgi:hypothetical protein